MNLLKVPCLVFYNDWFFDKFRPWAGGTTFAFVIFIRTKYKDDVGILEHEKVHVLQFWRTLGICGLLYLFSAEWRYKYELEAYRRQLQHSTAPARDAKAFAKFICTRYNLDSLKLTQTKVVEELRK
jgi:hypothetical protein